MGNTINFYVASCVPDGGVYRCKLDVDGKVETENGKVREPWRTQEDIGKPRKTYRD
jgi:hypothetical protein